MRRRSFSLLLLVAIAGCQAPPRDFVRVGVDVDAGIIDPRRMRDTTAYRVVDLIFDGLVRLDASLQPVPAIATRWEAIDDRHLRFELRDNVRFHDGSPLTAHDVVHTFETLLDPSFGAPLRSLYAPIASVRAVAEHEVEFELHHPYAPLLSYLDVGIVPRSGAEHIGTGPYRLDRWDRGSKIVLEAYAAHWAGAPTIPRIELMVVPDNTARAQAFEAGDVDLIQSPLSPRDVSRLADDDRYESVVIDGLAITYLNFNTKRAPLDEPELRRAIAMLIDRDTLVREIYEGSDRPAQSVLLPSWQAYVSDPLQPEFDPDGADELLDALGFVDSDEDGIRDRDGQPLAIELGTHSEDTNRVQTVEVLQNRLRRHGIAADIRISDWPSFSLRRDAGDFDVILLGWTQLVDPDRALYEQLHSRGGLNWGGFDSPRLDALLDEARAVSDSDARARLYRDAAVLIGRELPYYVLAYQSYQLFTTPRLTGFEPDRRGMLRSLATSTLAP